MRKAILFVALFSLPYIAFAESASAIASSTVRTASERREAKTISLTRILRRGMAGTDVRSLQESLQLIPGIAGDVTLSNYFGKSTESAVQRFQERYGVATAKDAEYGAVGPRTAIKINEIISLNARALIASRDTASSTKSAAASSSPTPQSGSGSGATSTTTSTSVTSSVDTKPPVRANGSPSGTLSTNTINTQITLSMTTNEFANCYWSNTPNTAYEYMGAAFSATGGTAHSMPFRIVSIGDFAFYVRCRDRLGNTNVSDYPILFSIEHRVGEDKQPPRIFMAFPIDKNALEEGLVNLSAVASDNAGIASVQFFFNDQNLNTDDTKSPYAVTLSLTPGEYSAFAVALDVDGNRATSTKTYFSVISKASEKTVLFEQFRLIAITLRMSVFPIPMQLASAASAFITSVPGIQHFFFNH